MLKRRRLLHECVGEIFGTFLLVFFGIGSVHAAVLTGAQAGLWQVAVVWGIGIALAIYTVAAVSGAHLNPAVTLALVPFGGFTQRKVPAYIASQLLGAVLAAATLYLLFSGAIRHFELAQGLTRGAPGSELSAMVYGEYFPNPAIARALKWDASVLTLPQAMLAEAIGTALLMLFILAITDARNSARPASSAAAVMIGLSVSVIISVVAPLTQAGLNPARDFGPRLFAYWAGWGSIAIPGPRGGFLTVYILSPIIGAMAGGAMHRFVLRPALRLGEEPAETDVHEEIGEQQMSMIRFLPVGGFLGAGKTTLIAQAARRLIGRGQKVGLITNDQAPDLVDTSILAGQGFPVQEVAGSCFCCNFDALLSAAGALRRQLPLNVILAEPVGSCTDLSATILQPMKDQHASQFRVAPLTVLTDPHRLAEILDGQPSLLHRDAVYIFLKQLEEADIVVVNKTDLLSETQRRELRGLLAARLPRAKHLFVSALTGEGVDEWLNAILAGAPAGAHIPEVDYDIYANGEAVLGWFNGSYGLSSSSPVEWEQFGRQLLDALSAFISLNSVEVGHIKLMIRTTGGECTGNLTRIGGPIFLRSELEGPTGEARLVLNARVQTSPEILAAMIERALAAAAGETIVATPDRIHSLQPGRPVPTHRYKTVVS